MPAISHSQVAALGYLSRTTTELASVYKTLCHIPLSARSVEYGLLQASMAFALGDDSHAFRIAREYVERFEFAECTLPLLQIAHRAGVRAGLVNEFNEMLRDWSGRNDCSYQWVPEMLRASYGQ
jgi:hypothetical protein